jgi:flavorubredoxin
MMPKVLVLFHSQEYGNTAAMAEAVAEGARASGAEAELFNTNDGRVSMEQYRGASAVAFGSPDYYSYIAGGLKAFLDDWHIAKKANDEGLVAKPYGLFYSHGGGGRVKDPLEKLFARAGTKIGETVESSGRPSEEALAACTVLGEQLATAARG